MRTFSWLWPLISGVLLSSLGCDTGGTPAPADASSSRGTVHIVTYKSHEVLNSIQQATIDSLVSSGAVRREDIVVYNPEGKLDELQSYVRTLSRRSTRMIIAVSTPATQATLASRHPSIPLVYSFVSNPAVLNADANDRNFTGIANVLDYARGLDMLRTLIPSVRTLGVIYNPSEANSSFSYSQIVGEARKQSPPIEVVTKQFSKAEEISSCMATMGPVDAVYVGGDNTLVQHITLLLQQAELRRIPVFASEEGSVQKGAIGAYSIDYAAFGRRTADLAVEVLNKRTAIGIQPIRHSEGRCVVNAESLVRFNIPFDYKRSGWVVK